MKARIILFVVLAIVTGSARSALSQQQNAAVAETLTLEQAIGVALQNNRSAKNAQLEAEKAGDKLAATRTRRLPSFKVTGLFSQPLTTFDTTFEKGTFGTFAGIGPVPAENTLISSSRKPTGLFIAQVQQPLSQLHRLNLQVRQMEAGREISQAQLRAKQQTIVNDVKRAYYAILQTQSSSRAAAEATKLYRELERVTGEYVLQQVALKTDQMNVQTKLANAEYEELTINNLLTSQKEQLNNLLGRDVRTDFTVGEATDTAQVMMRETDLAQARDRALQQRPEIREARLRVEQAKLDRRIKKSEFIPDVSLTMNYVSTFSYSNFLPRSVSGVGIQVEWEALIGGARSAKSVRRKRASVKPTTPCLRPKVRC